MPHPIAFLNAFNITKGATLGAQTKILKVSIKHIVVEQYKHYTFPMTIEIQTAKQLNEDDILKQFNCFLLDNKNKNNRKVNSQYGNPYNCIITDIQIKKKKAVLDHHQYYTITCLGDAVRIKRQTKTQ